jgi:hypothetical protein
MVAHKFFLKFRDMAVGAPFGQPVFLDTDMSDIDTSSQHNITAIIFDA